MQTRPPAGNDGMLIATFLLGNGTFGIDAHQVQEVSRLGELTTVHHAPHYVLGIRNLRGRIVTVLDLQARLGLGRVTKHAQNRILIVDVIGEPIGLLVDQAGDTLACGADDIVPPPPNLHGVQSQYLLGVCRGSERLVALLDLPAVLRAEAEDKSAAPPAATLA
jgi:purine-binding chemotaxis protein CheW